MASLQRFTEDKGYVIDEEFLMQVKHFNMGLVLRIAKFLDRTIDQIKDDEYELQFLGCVIDDNPDNPFYFAVEVYKDLSGFVTFYSIEEIDLDYDLDLINSKCYVDERRG